MVSQRTSRSGSIWFTRCVLAATRQDGTGVHADHISDQWPPGRRRRPRAGGGPGHGQGESSTLVPTGPGGHRRGGVALGRRSVRGTRAAKATMPAPSPRWSQLSAMFTGTKLASLSWSMASPYSQRTK